MVTKLLEKFITLFGSKWHFLVALIVTGFWLVPILTEGYGNWTTGIGLTGNNYESTAEYFLEIAILYTARVTDLRTAAMRKCQNTQLDKILLDQNKIMDLEEKISQIVTHCETLIEKHDSPK